MGERRNVISSRLGQSVENVSIIEATISAGEGPANPMSMTVVLGERNKGMNGINTAVASRHVKVFRPGSKGVLRVRCCNTERTSGGRES